MRFVHYRILAGLIGALTLGGCMTEGQQFSAAMPRGATITFESIDGPPPEIFRKLVNDLNDEAQSRRLAVVSRETSAAYRVRGYVATHNMHATGRRAIKLAKQGKTVITWVWDVYDTDQNRALRITGEETVPSARDPGGWSAADDAMLRRIARSGVDQLAAFLTAPPGAAPVPAERGAALAMAESHN